MLKINITFLCCLFALYGCGSSDSSDSSDSSSSNGSIQGLANCSAAAVNQAVICGKALASDGVTPLIGAEIKLVTDGPAQAIAAARISGASSVATGLANPNKCLTDSNGDFACLLPDDTDGAQEFIISLSGFADQAFNSNLVLGSVVESGTQTLTANGSQKWLVVPGAFDGVQVLLSQLKGCTLNNESGLPFNAATDDHTEAKASDDCTSKGLVVLDSADVVANLQTQALQEYDALFINCSANYNDFSLGVDGPINTNIKQFVNSGKSVYISDLSSSWVEALYPEKINFLGNATSTGTASGDVVYQPLENVIGNPVDIVFDLSVWSAIDTVSSDVTTFIEADIGAISSYMGIYPIAVGLKETVSSGCVFYTSYHIEGASTGAPQEVAIKYLVQNINNVCI